MRLLNVNSLKFGEFITPHDTPPYVILSHRWIRDEEVLFHDIEDKRSLDKDGWRKVHGLATYVTQKISHVEWMWIDTCCIDKRNLSELNEAIISMWNWYRDAEVCLAYLADVPTVGDRDAFRSSEWFRRGWTLQELLAPRTVLFLTENWTMIGHKGADKCKSGVQLDAGPSLTHQLVSIAGVPANVLNDSELKVDFTIEQRLQWTARRETTREEDMTYCLMGVFGLSMSVRYGEGAPNARKRLLNKINKAVAEHERLFPRPNDDGSEFADVSTLSQALPPQSWTTNGELKVYHVIFGGVDVTATFMDSFVSGNTIAFDTSALVPTLPDTWEGVPKSLVMLFSYGASLRVLSTHENQGSYYLRPGDVRYSPDTAEVCIVCPPPPDVHVKILAVFWSRREIFDVEVYRTLYACAATGQPFAWTNSFFGMDTWNTIHKTGVIFYKDRSGTPQALSNRESLWSIFPVAP